VKCRQEGRLVVYDCLKQNSVDTYQPVVHLTQQSTVTHLTNVGYPLTNFLPWL